MSEKHAFVDEQRGKTVVKPEIYVLDVTPDFERPPKGTLRLKIAAKGESGKRSDWLN